MIAWADKIKAFHKNLQELSVLDDTGRRIDSDAAFAEWQKKTSKIREARRTVFLIGNGASASMASHMAADLAKNVHVRTEVFSDLSLITAIANDIGYTEVFAEPIRRRMADGDMLVAISSSGESPNILRAVEEARNIGGFIVTLSAMNPDNTLILQGNINFYVPANTYGLAETCHAGILHHWMDLMAKIVKQDTQVGERGLLKEDKEGINKWQPLKQS